jgi:hypothetical protein
VKETGVDTSIVKPVGRVNNLLTLILTASKPVPKPRFVAEKSPYYPTARWGKGDAYSEDLLNENVSSAYILVVTLSSKAH